MDMSFSFFMFLPLPLKIIAFVMGGFFWLGFNQVKEVEMEGAQVEKAQIEAHRVERAMPAPAQRPAAIVKQAQTVVILVNADGSFVVGGKKLTAEQLQKRVKAIVAAQPNCKVTLKADALTPHQMIVSGVELCKKAGAKNVSFAAKQAAP